MLLLAALASGCHVENAAVAAGVSERTAYRRLASFSIPSRFIPALSDPVSVIKRQKVV